MPHNKGKTVGKADRAARNLSQLETKLRHLQCESDFGLSEGIEVTHMSGNDHRGRLSPTAHVKKQIDKPKGQAGRSELKGGYTTSGWFAQCTRKSTICIDMAVRTDLFTPALCEANPEASCHNHEAAACHIIASSEASAGESIWLYSSLQQAMGLAGNDRKYNAFRMMARKYMNRYLDTSRTLKQQDKLTVTFLLAYAQRKHQYLAKFRDNWPFHDFMGCYLRNHVQYTKKQHPNLDDSETSMRRGAHGLQKKICSDHWPSSMRKKRPRAFMLVLQYRGLNLHGHDQPDAEG
ncbi:hypothetical protein P692DRAFT_201811426 [Suillus brevipes Sb2]|nr:hypothetical protein P692DRAFT_201811426 [Suillus brevipes Sb2]